MRCIRLRIIPLFLVFCLGPGLLGQVWEKKAFTSWSEKDALRVLRKSPWCEEFRWIVRDDSDETRYGLDGTREIATIFRVNVFSARVVREAYVSLAAKGDASIFRKHHDYINQEFDGIVLALTLDSEPKGAADLLPIQHRLERLTRPELVTHTYLASESGKRVYLMDYLPPGPDGTGAKFIFPSRTADGSPFPPVGDKTIKFQTIEFTVKETYIGRQMALHARKWDDPGKRWNMVRRAAKGSVTESGRVVVVCPEVVFHLDKLVYRGRPDF
jgi:hypothetical protein